MLTNLDRHKAITKRNRFKIFDYNYPGSGIGYFNNHRSFNCGCSMCIATSQQHRIENKRDRAKAKNELKFTEP